MMMMDGRWNLMAARALMEEGCHRTDKVTYYLLCVSLEAAVRGPSGPSGLDVSTGMGSMNKGGKKFDGRFIGKRGDIA